MKINELIYHEIETIDPERIESDDDLIVIHNDVCARAIYDKNFEELNDVELSELNNDCAISIKCIKIDSLLFRALRYWFNAWNDYKILLDCIRGCVIKNGCLYYGAGWGYDTISDDLLGCQANGHAKEVFIKFCNEYEYIMEMGGRDYMYSLGYGSDVCHELERRAKKGDDQK